MKLNYYLLLSILVITLNSCINREDNAFSRALLYFPEGSIEHDVASYYNQYAQYHYGVSRRLVDSLGRNVKLDYKAFNTDTLFYQYLLNNKYRYTECDTILDIEAMTDSSLIRRIKIMSELRNEPWCKQLDWSDYCHYVLPYRVGDEELNDWYMYFHDKYLHTIKDSVSNTNSIREVSLYLLRCMKNEVKYGTRLGHFYHYKFLTPMEMERMHTLECKALAHYATLALRSCGVPCTMLETHWRFTEIVHSSVMIPGVKGNERAFRTSIYDEPIYMGEEKDTMATYRTWSYEFVPNQELQDLLNDKDVLPSFALPVTRKDITSLFSTTHTISLDIPNSLHNRKHLFLCRFHNWEWYAIREGNVSNGKVYFKNATIRQLYRLGYMQDGELVTFGRLFTLTGKGKIRPYDSVGDSVTYKIIYHCEPEERRLSRNIIVHSWEWDATSGLGGWSTNKGEAKLWAFNEKTGEYKEYTNNLSHDFSPVFHLLEIRKPKWTVFTGDDIPRPIGFIASDTITGEGYLMEF